MNNQTDILITSALPYVNNIPHLGNIIGCVLPADIIARYHRSKGKNVLYICGTDEYGTTTEIKAREEGVTPRELCNKYHQKHKEIYDWFNISFDIFGRTSTENPKEDQHYHTEISKQIFQQLQENNLLEKREVKQLYCPDISRFVADRFIVGTCPKCSDNNAKGDQCDSCGSIYESVELINPHLKGNNESALEIRSSEHYFLRLDLLQPRIQLWFDNNKASWSHSAVAITQEWLNNGLKPRCITRDMEWGTPLDQNLSLDNIERKVMYNWFDAPIGYISIAGERHLQQWWKGNNTKLIQFMGIDNVPFHSILFPGTLIGTDDNYNLVSDLVSCHHLQFEGKKFSKSEGRGIFCDQVMAMNIPVDYWRYYLMKIRSEDTGSNFVWTAFIDTCNADLCKNIGNLIHRVFSITHKCCGESVNVTLNNLDQTIYHDCIALVTRCNDNYDHNNIAGAINNILALSNTLNKYISDTSPWAAFKNNPDDPKNIRLVATPLFFVTFLIDMLKPITPAIVETVSKFLDVEQDCITVKKGFTPFFQPLNHV